MVCVWCACGVCVHTPLYTHTSPYFSRANLEALFDLLHLEGMFCLPEYRAVGSSGSAVFFPGSMVTTTVRPASLSVLSPGVRFIGCAWLGERALGPVLSPVIPVLLSFFAWGGLASSVVLYLRIIVKTSLVIYLAHFSTHSQILL